MSKHKIWFVAAMGVVAALVFAAWLAEVWVSRFATTVVDNFGVMAFVVFAAICSFLAARRSRGRQRATWLALAGGLSGWTLGAVVWAYDELWLRLPEPQFPSLADVGYLLFPVGAAVALVLFPGGRSGQSRTRLLDGLIVTGSLFVVSWVAVLGSVFRAGGTSHFALGVSLAYPVGDLVLVTMVVLVLIRAHTAQRLTLALLTAGIGLMSLSDSLFAYLTATNAYHPGSLIDVGWLAAFLLLGMAALSSTTEPVEENPTAQAPGRARLWLPYLPLVLAGAVVVHRSLRGVTSGPVPGVALGVVIVVLLRQFVTVAENRRLLVTVAQQASHDPLTGLANRTLFIDRLGHAVQLQRRELRPLAVLSLDLDDFKLVNDSLGHPAGDELLVQVAARLIGCLRGSDTVARLGGDEFAVLLEEGADRPLVVADRVVEAFGSVFMIDGHPLTVRPSIGLASAGADTPEVSAESLLKQADVAMYAAKRGGAGGVYSFRPDMHMRDLDEVNFRRDLIKAVGHG